MTNFDRWGREGVDTIVASQVVHFDQHQNLFFSLIRADFILGIVSVAGCIYCKLRNCKARKGNNKGKCNGPLF